MTLNLQKLSALGKKEIDLQDRLSQIEKSHLAQIQENHCNLEEFKARILPSIDQELSSLASDHNLSQTKIRRIKEQVIAPLEKYATCNQKGILAKILLDSTQIYQLINALSGIVPEAELRFQKEAIKISFMNPTRVSLSELYISAETYLNLQEGKAGLNLRDFALKLKSSKSENATTEIRLMDKSHTLFFKKTPHKYPPLRDKLALLDLDEEEIPMGNLNEIKYVWNFGISKRLLDYVLRCFNDIGSDILDIITTPKGITFHEVSVIGERELVIKREDLAYLTYADDAVKTQIEQEKATENPDPAIIKKLETDLKNPRGEGAFSLEFVNAIGRIMNLLEPEEIIHFHLRTEHPIRMYFEKDLYLFDETLHKSKHRTIGKITNNSYLAPRVPEENEEDF